MKTKLKDVIMGIALFLPMLCITRIVGREIINEQKLKEADKE